MIAAVVVAVTGLGLTAGAAPATVRVPNVRDRLQRGARSALSDAHLKTTDRVVDVAGAGANLVVGQHPRAGTRVKPGTRVQLTVASGYVVLPPGSLDGLSYAAAISALRRDSLRAAQLALALPAGDAGRVVMFTPAGRLKEGTVVALAVARRTALHHSGASAGWMRPFASPASVDAVVVSSSPPGRGRARATPQGKGPPWAEGPQGH